MTSGTEYAKQTPVRTLVPHPSHSSRGFGRSQRRGWASSSLTTGRRWDEIRWPGSDKVQPTSFPTAWEWSRSLFSCWWMCILGGLFFLALSTECPVRIMKMEAFGRFIKHHFRTCQVVDPQPRSTPMDLEDCGSKKPQQRFKPHQRNRRHMPEDFSCMRDAK
ncbi:hypothetical protein FOYG_08020 [Fusarium oxysporum NRRL 32931]|uniref:Uncharacterized protein n=1 Tax=Fusarium oxysporum NRRL 32931 TaxID=660029 RepID=W9ICE5_FUSOX|nr:hypothetical protein FOYG_08020 [Fusarium oxysporum NRRL 32931]